MKAIFYLLLISSSLAGNTPTLDPEDLDTLHKKSLTFEGAPPFLSVPIRPQRPYQPNDTAFEKTWKSLESGLYTLVESLPFLLGIALIYIGVDRCTHRAEGEEE